MKLNIDQKNFWKDLVLEVELRSMQELGNLIKDENGYPKGIEYSFLKYQNYQEGDFCPFIGSRWIEEINRCFDLKSSNEVYLCLRRIKNENGDFMDDFGGNPLHKIHECETEIDEFDGFFSKFLKKTVKTLDKTVKHLEKISADLKHDTVIFMSGGVWVGTKKEIGLNFGTFIKWETFVEYDWDINPDRILFTHKKDESVTFRYSYELNIISFEMLKTLLEYFLEKSGINKMSIDDLSAVDNPDTAKRFLPENRKVIIVNSDTGPSISTDLPVFKVSEIKGKFQFPPSRTQCRIPFTQWQKCSPTRIGR